MVTVNVKSEYYGFCGFLHLEIDSESVAIALDGAADVLPSDLRLRAQLLLKTSDNTGDKKESSSSSHLNSAWIYSGIRSWIRVLISK